MRLKRLVAPLIMGLLVGVGQEAMADDWGCQVLLCISDPRGATTEAECRPPIEKLWKHLRRGKPFPTCAMAGSAESGVGSYAKLNRDYFDPCPAGLQPTTAPLILLDGDRIARRPVEAVTDDSGRMGARACVGSIVRMITVNAGDGDFVPVVVYDRVEWQQPAASPTAIDVYIDGALYHRSRIR